jgi:enoyl-CoA hydratase/carnithine racemase
LQADLQDAMHAHLRYPEILAMMESEDRQEGQRAFAEKRPPDWLAS